MNEHEDWLNAEEQLDQHELEVAARQLNVAMEDVDTLDKLSRLKPSPIGNIAVQNIMDRQGIRGVSSEVISSAALVVLALAIFIAYLAFLIAWGKATLKYNSTTKKFLFKTEDVIKKVNKKAELIDVSEKVRDNGAWLNKPLSKDLKLSVLLPSKVLDSDIRGGIEKHCEDTESLIVFLFNFWDIFYKDTLRNQEEAVKGVESLIESLKPFIDLDEDGFNMAMTDSYIAHVRDTIDYLSNLANGAFNLISMTKLPVFEFKIGAGEFQTIFNKEIFKYHKVERLSINRGDVLRHRSIDIRDLSYGARRTREIDWGKNAKDTDKVTKEINKLTKDLKSVTKNIKKKITSLGVDQDTDLSNKPYGLKQVVDILNTASKIANVSLQSHSTILGSINLELGKNHRMLSKVALDSVRAMSLILKERKENPVD